MPNPGVKPVSPLTQLRQSSSPESQPHHGTQQPALRWDVLRGDPARCCSLLLYPCRFQPSRMVFISPPKSRSAVKCFWELINQRSFGTEPAVLWWRWKDRVARAGPEVVVFWVQTGASQMSSHHPRVAWEASFNGCLQIFHHKGPLPTKKHKAMVSYFACSGTLPTLSYSAVLFSLQSPPCLRSCGQSREASPVDKEKARRTERTPQCHQQNHPSHPTECSAEPEAWKYSAAETSNA